MEVGDYVRTPQGIIAKIINIQEDTGQYFLNGNAVSLESKNYIADKNITIGENFKHSPNIIDLIEIGDLVRIEVEKDNTNVFEVCAINYNDNEIGVFNNNFEFDWASMEQVKSIVTKEQFEAIKYEIK